MIQDNTPDIAAGSGLLLPWPAAGSYLSSSFGLDLNPDFGTGQNARKGPLPGMGGDIVLRCDVASAFVVGAGTPVVQLHAVLSTVGAGVQVHTGEPIIIGSVMPSIHLASGRFQHGLVAAQLTLNTSYFMRLNPWTAAMGRNSVGATVIGKDYRYLGVMFTQPLADVGGGATHFFSTGAMTARLVTQGDVLQNPKDFVYPAGTRMTG